MNLKTLMLKTVVVLACAPILVTACGGRSDAVVLTPAITEAVPAEASASASAATQYVAALSALAAEQTDALEPVNPVPDSLATDDTAEPRLVD
jgi:uncharacterized lipoprotein YajG